MQKIYLAFDKIYPSLKKKYIKKHPERKYQLNQKYIASETFISETTLSKLINGRQDITRDYVGPLAKFFEVSELEIITGISPKHIDIHEQTGLSEQAILWLKAHHKHKPNRLEMLNSILEDATIANSLMDILCLFALTNIKIQTSEGVPFGNNQDKQETLKMYALSQISVILDKIYTIHENTRNEQLKKEESAIIKNFFSSRRQMEKRIKAELHDVRQERKDGILEVNEDNKYFHI